MTGQAEFLRMDALSDRQAKTVPFRIAGLTMWRYGVMNVSLHTPVGHELLQGVAMRTEDREDMPDAGVEVRGER